MEEKQNTFKPKLRITLLEDNGAVIQDRLVDATTEYYSGPKIQHKGPLRLEVTLTSNTEVESFKKYLDKLIGNLPIKAPSAGRGRPAGSTDAKEIETPREDILNDVEELAKNGKDQTEVIEYLRKLGFVFILAEDFLYYFKDFKFEPKDVGDPNDNKQYPNSLAWMVRCVKKGKDPRTDKFDPMILFGFNIQKPSRKVIPYLYKVRKEAIKIEKSKKVLSFNTVEFTKLPAYMLEPERLKFSVEQRQLLLNPEKKPSKFFLRWVNDAVFPDSIKPKIEEILSRVNE
jgi:hypothetical protein